MRRKFQDKDSGGSGLDCSTVGSTSLLKSTGVQNSNIMIWFSEQITRVQSLWWLMIFNKVFSSEAGDQEETYMLSRVLLLFIFTTNFSAYVCDWCMVNIWSYIGTLCFVCFVFSSVAWVSQRTWHVQCYSGRQFRGDIRVTFSGFDTSLDYTGLGLCLELLHLDKLWTGFIPSFYSV
jgi:hypothetical protein